MKDGALKDLELCEAAARLDLEECQRRLFELEKKVRLVEEGLGAGEEAFEEVMNGFVSKAKELSRPEIETSGAREATQAAAAGGGGLDFGVSI